MSAYLDAVIADAPTHYWRLADPGGFLAHDIGSTVQHLIATPSGVVPQLGYSGPVSDGGSSYIGGAGYETGGAVLLTAPFTLECWDFTSQWNTGGFVLDPDQDTSGVAIGIDAGPVWAAWYDNAVLHGAAVPSTNTWHHLVGVYGAANVDFYVDAALAATVAFVQATITKVIFVGRRATGSAINHFVSEAAVYSNKALTAARISAHFAAADNSGQAPIFNLASGIALESSGGGSGAFPNIVPDINTHYVNAP
jgi:concanavalin A-like lectin/glucanase superfamily protein